MNKPQTLSSLLNSVRTGGRSSIIPKTTLSQMQKLIISKSSPVYHYEVLHLYNHFSFVKDQVAFTRLDSLFFPARNNQERIQPSLQIAYRRLYCLMKYQMPYISWINKVRELLQESTVTSTDMKFIFNLGSSDVLVANKEYLDFLDQFQAIFLQEFDKIDASTLIALRKYFGRNRMRNKNLREAKIKMDEQIESALNYFTASQLKFLLQTKKINIKELFVYFFKFHNLPKKYSFFLLLQSSRLEWADWARKKFTRKQLLESIPSNQLETKPYTIIDGIYSHFITQRPYIDQFFDFIEIEQAGKKVTRLKNPQQDYSAFLFNSTYYLHSGVQTVQEETLQKIIQVLSETKYLQGNIYCINTYFSVRLSVMNYSKLERSERLKQEKELILETYELIKTSGKSNLQILRNPMLYPSNSFKNLATFEFEIYQMPEFLTVYQRIAASCRELSQQLLSGWLSLQFHQIEKVVNQYIAGKKPIENSMFFGEFKKIPMGPDSKFQVSLAKNVQINQSVFVQHILKFKNLETKKESKCLFDVSYAPSVLSPIDISLKNRIWKVNYIKNWCGLNYYVFKYTGTQEYLESPQFMENLKIMINQCQ